MQEKETQPYTSDNEILEVSRDFDKTPSNSIIDIQTPTLQKSLPSENLGTSQDTRNIRAQFSDDTAPYACAIDILIVALELQAPATKLFNCLI